MTLPKWLPHPSSLLSALALKSFAWAYAVAAGLVLPLLFELAEHSPRLAWLGILGLWTAPMAIIAVVHRAAHGLLDMADGRDPAPSRPVDSAWAGLFSWAALLLVSMTTSFVMLVLDPPPLDPDARGWLASAGSSALFEMASWQLAAHSVVWFVLAVGAFQLHRAAREPR